MQTQVFSTMSIIRFLKQHWLEWYRAGRGRIDHFGLNASSRETFEHVRVRLMQLGASDGTITDFGTTLSVFFRDPDGLEAEALWNKDPASQEDKI